MERAQGEIAGLADNPMTNLPQTVIVVPTYNERDNVGPFFARVREFVPDARVLFVDDNSPDGTGEVIDSMVASDSAHVSVLHRKEKNGLGAAYVAGYLHALEQWPGVAYLVQMDADLSHDPKFIPDLLDAVKTADVAIGSRYVHGVSVVNWPLRRLLISQMGTLFAKTVTGMPVTDLTSGFKCYRADVLRAVDLNQVRASGFVFQVETIFRAWRMGYRLQDVPIIFYERTTGQSKMDLHVAIEGVFVVLRLGVDRMFRAASPPKYTR